MSIDFKENNIPCIIFASTAEVFFACHSFNEGMESEGGALCLEET
jgi:hypothetical protein